MAASHPYYGGRLALLSGGASGIGRALGEELAARGAKVVLADRQRELAEEVAAAIRGRGGEAFAVELDVRSAADFLRIAEDLRRRHGAVDLLFNNAGIGAGGEMAEYDLDDWNEVIAVNLGGVVHGIQAVYPAMVERRSGHIVNTASIAGLVATPSLGSYTTTKHAVVGLSKALRVEAKEHGVRVSALCPGIVRTAILTGGRYGRIKSDLDRRRMEVMARQLKAMEPGPFAGKVLDAVARNVAIIVVPGWWRLFWYIERLSPLLSMALAAWLLRRTQAELEAPATS